MTEMPDKEQIEDLLEGYLHPRPSKRFYAIINRAEWNRSPRSKMAYLQGLTVALVLMAVMVWTVPPIQALAHEIITALIVHTSLDTVDYPIPEIFDAQYPRYFNSVSEAQPFVDFAIVEPTFLPESFSFFRVELSFPRDPADNSTSKANQATLIYRYVALTGNYVRSGELMIVYRFMGNVPSGVAVGASAEITPMSIEGIDAQYTGGRWTRLEEGLYWWNRGNPLQMIAWRNGDVLFSVSATTRLVDMEDLTAVAEDIILSYAENNP